MDLAWTSAVGEPTARKLQDSEISGKVELE